MKVTAVRTFVLEVPSRGQIALRYPYHRFVVAEIRTDEDVDGLGYCLMFGGTGDGDVHSCLERYLAPPLLGSDPLIIEEHWLRMSRVKVRAESSRALAYATAAVDIALWDLRGKVANLPLARLWGGTAQAVPCYGSGGWPQYEIEDLLAEAERYASYGCTRYKLKVHDPDPLVNRGRVKAVAESLGPSTRLMVDRNQLGDVESNKRQAELLEDFDLVWYEEPVPAYDLEACAAVAGSIRIPVATGENNLTVEEFQEIADRQCARYLMPDVCRARGFSEVRRIGKLAASAGLQVAPHLVPELSLHVVASLPTGFCVEYMDWLPEDLFEGLPKCHNGMLLVPERPGHGVTLTPTAISRYQVA